MILHHPVSIPRGGRELCLARSGGGEFYPSASSGWKPGMLWNIPPLTGQPPPAQNYLGQMSTALRLENPLLEKIRCEEVQRRGCGDRGFLPGLHPELPRGRGLRVGQNGKKERRGHVQTLMEGGLDFVCWPISMRWCVCWWRLQR